MKNGMLWDVCSGWIALACIRRQRFSHANTDTTHTRAYSTVLTARRVVLGPPAGRRPRRVHESSITWQVNWGASGGDWPSRDACGHYSTVVLATCVASDIDDVTASTVLLSTLRHACRGVDHGNIGRTSASAASCAPLLPTASAPSLDMCTRGTRLKFVEKKMTTAPSFQSLNTAGPS